MTPPEKGSESQKIFVQRVSCNTLNKDSAEKIIDKGIAKVFLQNLESGKQSLADIQEKGILLPYKLNGKDVYVKRIRLKAKPTSPIVLKKHNNVINKNPKEYKQNYYVVNDENYLIAIYRGKDVKGKMCSSSLTLNLLDAIKAKNSGEELYPIKKNGLDLYKVLKIGKIVILQEKYDEDVFALPEKVLWNRMYRIAGLAKSGNIAYIKFSQIISGRPWEYLAGKNDLNCYSEFRRYQDNQFIGLVEGTDFTISPAGEIIQN